MTEVWLESLSMHLSVGMPLPSDLLFDIQHYRGISPSSSGSTTPEGIPSGHRSPALEPICEGKLSPLQKKMESKDGGKKLVLEHSTPIVKVSSADCLLKNIEHKVKNNALLSKSCDNCSETCEKCRSDGFYTKSCEDFSKKNIESNGGSNLSFSPKKDLKSFPNYENINFLQNDSVFSNVTQKITGIKNVKESDDHKEKRLHLDIKKCNNETENNTKEHKFAVPLRRVPKNFTRNRVLRESKKAELDNEETMKNPVKDKIKFLGKHSTFEVNKPQTNTSSKFSNLSLQSMALKGTTSPSRVTQKYVNITSPKSAASENAKSGDGLRSECASETFTKIPDIVSSTLTRFSIKSTTKPSETASCSSPNKYSTNKAPTTTTNTFSINKNIFDATKRSPNKTSAIKRNVLHNDKSPLVDSDVPAKSCDKLEQSCSASGHSSSLVKNIIETLNRRDRNRLDFDNRSAFGRSSLKVIGNPKVDVRVPQLRSCSPEEFTAL